MIDEISTVIGGGTPSTKVGEYFCENGIPWLSRKDLSGYEWKYISKGATDITALGLKNSSAKLMPKGSVLFSSRAPIGYIAIAENEICTNQGFKSLIPNKGVSTEYLFQLLKSNADKIESVATGSTFKEVSGSALKGIEVLIPSDQILEQFTKSVTASNKRALLVQKESQTLTLLRDTLLPELISGRVRVKNI
jgi:type I restriction enzyme S subunit